MRAHVHIIEDEDSVRESLLALLNACGWEASGYATATGFLSALSDESNIRPQCLIVDIQLPGMSGLDLLSELLRRGETIPAIVMTGHGDDELRTMAAERNAVGYFLKPFNSAELLNAVSGVLSQVS